MNFNKICNEPGYQLSQYLDPEIYSIANHYRVLRNKIHLPSHSGLAYNYGDNKLKKVIDFINSWIIDFTNNKIESIEDLDLKKKLRHKSKIIFASF